MLHRQQQQVPVSEVPCGQSADQLPGCAEQVTGTATSADPQWRTVDDFGRELEAALPPAGPPARLLVVQDASRLLHWLGPAALCLLMRRGCDRGERPRSTSPESAVTEDLRRGLSVHSRIGQLVRGYFVVVP